MGIELGAIRISSLNRLMHYFLSYGRGTSRELLNSLGYSSLRMLQRDISYLRNECSVDIMYDFSRQLYICRNSGHFILYFSFAREEAVLLAVSLSIASGILAPESSARSETLYKAQL